MSVGCSEARSSWVYERTRATSSEIAAGRLLDLRRAARSSTARWPPTRPRARAATGQRLGEPLAPGEVGPGRRERAGRAASPRPTSWSASHRRWRPRARPRPASPRVACCRGAPGASRPARRTASGLICSAASRLSAAYMRADVVPSAVDGAGRRGRRVVELVRQARGERAEGHEGLPLAGRRLHAADRPHVPPDEVHAEREPLAGQRAEGVGLQREHPPVAVAAPRGEVASRASSHAANPPPSARDGQPPHHGVLGADAPQQGDRPLQEHPPEDRRLALVPELLALAEGADLASRPARPAGRRSGSRTAVCAQLRGSTSLHQVVAR